MQYFNSLLKNKPVESPQPQQAKQDPPLNQSQNLPAKKQSTMFKGMNVKKTTQYTQEIQQQVISPEQIPQQVFYQEAILQQEEIPLPQLEESNTPSKQSSDSKKPSSFGFLKNKQTKINETPSTDIYQEPPAFIEQPKRVWGYVEESETNTQSEISTYVEPEQVPVYVEPEQVPVYQNTPELEQPQITYEENPPNVWGSLQEQTSDKPKSKRPWRFNQKLQQDSQQNVALVKPTTLEQSPIEIQQQPSQLSYSEQIEYQYLEHQQQNQSQQQISDQQEEQQNLEIDKFEILKEYLQSNLNENDKELKNHLSQFQVQLLSIFDEEILLEQEQDINSKGLEQLQYKISQLNGQLQAAVELEQFQKADDIQSEQDELNIHISELKQKMDQNLKNIETLQLQRWKLKTESAEYYLILIDKLKSEEGNHQQVIDDFNAENNQEIEKIVKIIKDERESLKNKHQEFQSKFQNLDKQQEQLNEEIKIKTQVFEEKRVQLEDQQKTSMDEINELKRLLQEKEKILKQIQYDLKDVVKKISETKNSFDQKIDQIIDEKVTLQDEIQQIDQEKVKVDILEQNANVKQAEYQEKYQSLQTIFNKISQFNKNIEEKNKLVSEDISKEKSIYEMIKASKEKLLESYQKLKESESNRDGLVSKRGMIEETQSEMLAEQKQLNEKLPQLLSEKNANIQSKNYKGAQVVTNQIKKAQQQIEEVEQNLKISEEKIAQVNQEIDQHQSIVEEMKQQYLEYQVHYEIERQALIELRLNNLQGIEEKNLSKPFQGVYQKNMELIQQELKKKCGSS